MIVTWCNLVRFRHVNTIFCHRVGTVCERRAFACRPLSMPTCLVLSFSSTSPSTSPLQELCRRTVRECLCHFPALHKPFQVSVCEGFSALVLTEALQPSFVKCICITVRAVVATRKAKSCSAPLPPPLERHHHGVACPTVWDSMESSSHGPRKRLHAFVRLASLSGPRVLLGQEPRA